MYKPVEIDYSDIPQPVAKDITQWEPPRHVYFGPKGPNGRTAPEPKPSMSPYPSTRYAKNNVGGLRAIEVADVAADGLLDAEVWKHSPADHGYMTHPTKEMLRAYAEQAAIEDTKRGPGRPKAA